MFKFRIQKGKKKYTKTHIYIELIPIIMFCISKNTVGDTLAYFWKYNTALVT